MTLKTDILADLSDVFFNTDEFAVSATLDVVTTITGIFDNEFIVTQGVETLAPVFRCATADAATAAHGSTLVIDGTTYYVVGIQPDGTGVTMLILSKD